MNRLLAGLLLVVSLTGAGAPRAATAGPEDFQALIHSRDFPPLTVEGMQSILRHLDLNWPLSPDSMREGETVRTRNLDAVYGFPSSTGSCYLLVGARLHYEGGIGGPARFCLIDSTGNVLWKRENQDTVMAMPVIASSGMTALILRSPPGLRVKFVTRQGDVTGSAAWTDLAGRPHQRTALQEVYDFSPNGDFLISLNQSKKPVLEINSTTFYCVGLDGTIKWSRRLGKFDPHELAFSTSGHRIVLDNLRRAGEKYLNQVWIMDSTGREIARHRLPRVRGADGSCLDPESGQLYLYDDHLVAIDIETGTLRRSVSPEALQRLAETAPPGSRTRNVANQLLWRVQQEKK